MIRGVLLTHPISSADYKTRPIWRDMVDGYQGEGVQDMRLLWAIGVADSKRKEGEDLPQIFAQLAKAYFTGKTPWLSTFSPIAQQKYENFIQGLKDSGLADKVIQEHGIYLYLASTPVQGPWPYVKYIKQNGFVRPEQFFRERKWRLLDGLANFHVFVNGAQILDVLPYKDGFTRPEGAYTMSYGYIVPAGEVGNADKGFRDLINVPVPDNAQVIPGGVAIQNIALTAQGGGLRLILDDAAIEALTSDTFSGLTPSVVSVTAIESPQAGLGIK